LVKIGLQELKNWLLAYFCMDNPKNWSRDDLPTPHILAQEVFADIVSYVKIIRLTVLRNLESEGVPIKETRLSTAQKKRFVLLPCISYYDTVTIFSHVTIFVHQALPIVTKRF
jgi:hypothetical protein